MKDSILKTVKKMGNFKKFLKIAKITDHIDSLDDCASFTVFAPCDKVFKRMRKSVFINQENEKDLLRILKKHIVKGKMSFDDLKKKKKFNSMNGEEIKFCDDNIVNDYIKVVKRDIRCKNGIIHMVDGLM